MGKVNAINNGTSMINKQVKVQKRRTMVKAATIGAAAGAVLYLAQRGKLNPKEGGNKIIETGKSILRRPAVRVLNGINTINTTINAKLEQAAKTKYWAGWIIEHGKAAKRFVNKQAAKFSDLAYSISNAAESIFNKAKFAPDKANAADFAAETFNNFVK